MSATLTPSKEQEALVAEPYAEERRMVEQTLIGTEAFERMNEIDAIMEARPDMVRQLPLYHLFPKGQYVRTIFMPAGTRLTTRVHLVEHPFFILTGSVEVWGEDGGYEILNAPHVGLTKPGTRRVIRILADCLWATVHLNPTEETDPEKIVERVTYDHRKLKPMEEAAI